MRKRIAPFFTIITFLVFTQFIGQAFSASIPITNPSFEDHDAWTQSSLGGFWNQSVVGWNLSDLGGPSLRGTIRFINDVYLSQSSIPDGDNVAWSIGGIISQVLQDTLLGGYKYELQCYVGISNAYPFPNYSVQLLAGGDVLAQENSLSPAADQFLLSSLTYTSSLSDTHIGQPLEIRLINYENTPVPPHKQILFDLVTLNASPAPAPLPTSIFLIGSGLLLLLPFRKKTRR